MIYRDIWSKRAFEQMNAIVLSHPERKAEFAAVLRWLHEELTTSPETTGESREPPYRVRALGGLSFRFRVVPEDRTVYVVRVGMRLR